MIREEIETIQKLTGAGEDQITLCDDGFMSRGYLVDGGRLVFKFKKLADTTYVYEAANLDYLNRQDLGVQLQRVAFTAEDDRFLGLYGVPGVSLEQCTLDDAMRLALGRQLGRFLQKLHALQPQTGLVYPLDELIGAWQARYASAKGTLARCFTAGELARIDALMMRQMPDTLRALGEKRVFSHGDLGDGNIFVDNAGRAGVIDFNDSGYMDGASDFMDITDDALCAAVLDAYGADEALRKKVAMQRRIRPVFVLDVYAQRGDAAVQKLVRRVRQELGREAE